RSRFILTCPPLGPTIRARRPAGQASLARENPALPQEMASSDGSEARPAQGTRDAREVGDHAHVPVHEAKPHRRGLRSLLTGRRVKRAIPWLLSLCIVAFLFLTTDLAAVGAALESADWGRLVLGMAVVTLAAYFFDSLTLVALFRRYVAPV